jgi:hypothetical protein
MSSKKKGKRAAWSKDSSSFCLLPSGGQFSAGNHQKAGFDHFRLPSTQLGAAAFGAARAVAKRRRERRAELRRNKKRQATSRVNPYLAEPPIESGMIGGRERNG